MTISATIWTADNRPEDHPLWLDEVAIENDMLTEGADRYRAAVNKAIEKETLSTLGPYRRIMKEFIEPVAKGISDWRAEQARKRGRKPVALEPMSSVEDDVLALITIRGVLDRMATGKAPLLNLAFNLGLAVEHEARMCAWRKADPELWELIQHSLTRQKATAVHRRRVNINRFNVRVREQIGWVDWSADVRKHVGFTLVDALVTSTSRFKLQPDPSWQPPRNRNSKLHKRPLVVVADPELLEWLNEAIGRQEILHPVFMPTLIPPAHWSNMRDGGYHTDLVPRRPMIRFKADHEEQRQLALQDLSAVDMPEVYAALNTIQNVPWRINTEVYSVAIRAWEKDLNIAGLPLRQATPLPYRDPVADTDADVHKAWKVEAAKVHGANARRVSQVLKAARSLGIAGRLLGKPFYFPHVIDFRGRMYPIPVDLQPQGEDLARGLLTFAEGKPMGPAGADWLAIQVCNTSGNDKVPFEDRIEWTRSRDDLWRAIADDPLGVREWADADEPWQHLAAVLEWARYLDEGVDMVSSLPIRIDGTCNGIQHLSAMIRDEIGGAAVNLTPSNRPRDIYAEVAELVRERLLSSPDPLAQHWLVALGGVIPRSLTKRQVMILPYGGTRHAYFGYTIDWMNENDPDAQTFPLQERGKLARFLTNILWEVVNSVLVRARSVQEWLKDLAKEACKTGAPISWETPLGFVVRHFYGERVMRRIKTEIDGQRIDLVDWQTTATLDPDDQIKGVAPNFTHSMDAAALMESILEASAKGVSALTSIHDAYGTVAADVTMLNACLRRAFVTIYEHDVLGYYEAAIRRLTDNNPAVTVPLKARPPYGTLNVEDVLYSTYFFA